MRLRLWVALLALGTLLVLASVERVQPRQRPGSHGHSRAIEPLAERTDPTDLPYWRTLTGRGAREPEVPVFRYELEAKALPDFRNLGPQGARFIPAFEGGAVKGFKLLQIKPGSIYATIGLQNDDVIRKIDGIRLESVKGALEAYERSRGEDTVRLEVERGHKLRIVEVRIAGL